MDAMVHPLKKIMTILQPGNAPKFSPAHAVLLYLAQVFSDYSASSREVYSYVLV